MTGDYCDVYLTHDSMSVRKAHNSGRNHLRNVVEYYQQIGHEKAQSVIDSITNSYAAEGQANPMLLQQHPHPGAPGSFPPPPASFGLPGRPGQMPPPFGIPPPGAPGGLPLPGGRGMPPFQPPFPIPGAAPNSNNSGPGQSATPPSLPAGMPLPPGGVGGGGLPFPPPAGGLPANFPPPPGFPGAPQVGGSGGGPRPPVAPAGSSISPPPPPGGMPNFAPPVHSLPGAPPGSSYPPPGFGDKR